MATENTKGIRIAALVIRYLMGLIFFVFGLNGFLNFLPQPELTAEGQTFMGGLFAAGYFFPLLKGIEVIAGALLLSGFYVPLAIALLGPITLNIFLMHVAIEPAGIPMAIFVFFGNLFLAYAYRDHYKAIFAKK